MIPITIQIVQMILSLAVLDPFVEVRAIDNRLVKPFQVEGKAGILFFLSTECPISRFYATEIQRICKQYGDRGVGCRLLYEDLPIEPGAVRQHLNEFGYRGIPAIIDSTGNLARQTGASMTPQAVIIDKAGEVRYRGRINNFYADLGKPRRRATVHDLIDALDDVLAGRKVLYPETAAVGCYITPPEGK
jgi:thiol-disulfide isomerase/thioredoxin